MKLCYLLQGNFKRSESERKKPISDDLIYMQNIKKQSIKEFP